MYRIPEPYPEIYFSFRMTVIGITNLKPVLYRIITKIRKKTMGKSSNMKQETLLGCTMTELILQLLYKFYSIYPKSTCSFLANT